MDYFDSNMKDKLSDYDNNLPPGMDWEDMREGVYEKMEKRPSRLIWKWFSICLLLLMGGCGSWMAINYLDGLESTKNQEESVVTTELVTKDESNEGKVVELNNKKNIEAEREQKNNATNHIKQEVETINIDKKDNRSDLINPTKIENSVKPSQNAITHIALEGNIELININDKVALGQLKDASTLVLENENETGINSSTRTEKGLTSLVNKSGLLLEKNREIEEELLQVDLSPVADNKKPLKPSTAKFFVGLSGGAANWLPAGTMNTNKNYVSGFPGFSATAFLQYSLNDKNALQLSYQYSFLQELFDYEATKNLEIEKPNTLIRQYVSSLNGNVHGQSHGDTTALGTRYLRELTYNAYRFHFLKLQYSRSLRIGKKSTIALSLGGDYLFSISGKGKRLNNEEDIMNFDKDNAIFSNNQFGLNVAVAFQYQIAKRTYLFTQVDGSKYLTNWELQSNGETKPLIYGLSIGLRQALK